MADIILKWLATGSFSYSQEIISALLTGGGMTQIHPMAKLEKLLLSTDGSDFSEGAVREGIKLAKICSSKLVVMSVIETNPEFEVLAPRMIEKEEKETRDRLERVKSTAAKEGVECEMVARHAESPFRAIIEEAEKNQANMIIMGRRGRTGLRRLLMGSVTAKVIGHSPCNVLVVPKAAEISYRKILVATDGSKYSVAAASEAIGIARRCRASLVVISVVPSETASPFDIVHSEMQHEMIAQKEFHEGEKNVNDLLVIARQEGVTAEGLIIEGRPYEVIVESAREKGVDLIVMGSHGRTGLERLLMGSVTERVVGHADCSVLIVKT
jgi:nucleotide-binding universal stress UspA family protein